MVAPDFMVFAVSIPRIVLLERTIIGKALRSLGLIPPDVPVPVTFSEIPTTPCS